MAGIFHPVVKTGIPAAFPATPTRIPAHFDTQIINYAMYMKRNGSAEETIIHRIRTLYQIAKHTDLNNPEAVKDYITSQSWKKSTQRKTVDNYKYFTRYLGLQFAAPKIRPEQHIPFIPTEQEIDQLIASVGRRTAQLLQMLKETGIRISEAAKLKWSDLDTQRKVITITPAKGSNPRILPVSTKLINMLNERPRTHTHIFGKPNENRGSFDQQRKAAADKLQNPRILQISFHTLRHFKGTMEYHKTRDIMHVKNVLGHKSIDCTMIYINIEQALFLTENDEWTCKVAQDEQEEIKLNELGFTYVRTLESGKPIYRKRK